MYGGQTVFFPTRNIISAWCSPHTLSSNFQRQVHLCVCFHPSTFYKYRGSLCVRVFFHHLRLLQTALYLLMQYFKVIATVGLCALTFHLTSLSLSETFYWHIKHYHSTSHQLLVQLNYIYLSQNFQHYPLHKNTTHYLKPHSPLHQVFSLLLKLLSVMSVLIVHVTIATTPQFIMNAVT